MRRYLTRFALAALAGCCLIPPLQAEDLALYTGETPVASQDEAERTHALPAALAQALVRVSGDGSVASDPALQPKLEAAPQLMRQFSYRQVNEPGPGGAPQSHLYLSAQFDPAGVNQILGELKRPVWGQERPQTLVLLVVDSGGPKQIASAAQAAALSPLTRAAELRGIPLKFPLMDPDDLIRIDEAAAWEGDAAKIAGAAQRYGTPLTFLVRLNRAGSGWTGRFTLFEQFGGSAPENWSTTFPDAASVLSAAAGGLADRLAHRYAMAGVQTKPTEYRVWVDKLDNADDYGRVLKYLSGVSGVRAVEPEAASGDSILFKLTMTMTLERFRQVLTFEHRLNVTSLEPADGASARLALVR
jgi:hypothetical protein